MVKYDYLLVLGYPNVNARQWQIFTSRLKVAILLYRKGTAAKVLVSGGARKTRSGLTEADEMEGYLVAHGIPRSAITKERQSRNTIENAFFSRQIMKKKSSMVIVTSEFHVPRAKYIFRELYGNGYRLGFVGSSTDKRLLPKARWFESASLDHVRDALKGINEKSRRPEVMKRLREIRKNPKTPEMVRRSWY